MYLWMSSNNNKNSTYCNKYLYPLSHWSLSWFGKWNINENLFLCKASFATKNDGGKIHSKVECGKQTNTIKVSIMIEVILPKINSKCWCLQIGNSNTTDF